MNPQGGDRESIVRADARRRTDVAHQPPSEPFFNSLLEVTRYSAPESIVGAVSAASDWWSLGMIMLEQATAGACFAGVHEKAFLIHVVTRGVELPGDLEPELRPLLRGLLARDPLKRWCWPQV